MPAIDNDVDDYDPSYPVSRLSTTHINTDPSVHVSLKFHASSEWFQGNHNPKEKKRGSDNKI